MTITNKKLKNLLEQFPDESLVFISNGNYDEDMPYRDINSLSVEYFDNDNYQTPEIVLK